MLCSQKKFFYRPIPDGFTVTSLKPEHVDSILQAWIISSVFTDCRQWLTEMIDLFPGVCILDSNGDPATWVLRQEFGTIGMLHVVPKYRRTNLGSVATMLMARKIYEDNYNVFSMCVKDNTASLAFHKRNKFEKVKDFTVGLVKYQFQSLLQGLCNKNCNLKILILITYIVEMIVVNTFIEFNSCL